MTTRRARSGIGSEATSSTRRAPARADWLERRRLQPRHIVPAQERRACRNPADALGGLADLVDGDDMRLKRGAHVPMLAPALMGPAGSRILLDEHVVLREGEVGWIVRPPPRRRAARIAGAPIRPIRTDPACVVEDLDRAVPAHPYVSGDRIALDARHRRDQLRATPGLERGQKALASLDIDTLTAAVRLLAARFQRLSIHYPIRGRNREEAHSRPARAGSGATQTTKRIRRCYPAELRLGQSLGDARGARRRRGARTLLASQRRDEARPSTPASISSPVIGLAKKKPWP